jgi:hypothetical protein
MRIQQVTSVQNMHISQQSAVCIAKQSSEFEFGWKKLKHLKLNLQIGKQQMNHRHG